MEFMLNGTYTVRVVCQQLTVSASNPIVIGDQFVSNTTVESPVNITAGDITRVVIECTDKNFNPFVLFVIIPVLMLLFIIGTYLYLRRSRLHLPTATPPSL